MDAQRVMYVQTRTVLGASGVDAQIVIYRYVQTRTVMGGGLRCGGSDSDVRSNTDCYGGGGSGVEAQIVMYVQTRTVLGTSGVDAQILMYDQTCSCLLVRTCILHVWFIMQ